MARRIVHQLVDDLDGTVLEVGEGETVLFSLDGVAYEIDLTDDNAARAARRARPVRRRRAIDLVVAARAAPAAGRRAGAAAPGSRTTAPIRAWAKDERLRGLGAGPGSGIRPRSLRSRALTRATCRLRRSS